MRKMYWEDLPTWSKGTNVKEGNIKWSECLNKTCKFTYDNIEGEIEIVSHDGETEKIGVKYLDNDVFYIAIQSFRDCRIGILIGVIKKEHIYSIGEIINDKLKITRQIPSNSTKRKSYECECIECGFNSDMEYYRNGILQIERWSILEKSLKIGNSCPVCCTPSKTIVTNINSMWKTHNYMIEKYGIDEEFAKKHTYSSSKKAPVKCPDCGRELEKSASCIYSQNGAKCICRDGIFIPEKFIISVLNQIGIEYKYQLTRSTLKWCDKYRYDFYIPEANCIIETHGEQHYINNKWDSVENIQKNDELKKELAMNNEIKEENYIIIDCRKSELEFIKNNILNSSLAEMYDLSKIDWTKVWEFCQTNLSKKACDLWNESNGELTCKDIACILNVNHKTIVAWLKQWVKLNLCSYDTNEEKRKGSSKAGKSNKKTVEIFENNVLKGVFESATDLANQSFSKFNIELTIKGISAVCSGVCNTYRGFTFRYKEGSLEG